MTALLFSWALFIGLVVMGAAVAIHWWRAADLPFPERPTPQRIFRLVHREDRAAYVRIMRRTMAVQMRDLSRAFDKMARQIGQVVIPAVERFAVALQALFAKEPRP